MKKSGISTPSLSNGDEVILNDSVYLSALYFTGSELTNYSIGGGGTIFFSSGVTGTDTHTTISNTGSGDVTINVPLVLAFSSESPVGSYSSTLDILQQGSGNIIFNQAISGTAAGVTVTADNNTGYVFFKVANTFSEGFTLNSGVVYVGNDAALGSGTNAVVRLRGGSLYAKDGFGTDAPRAFSNDYEFDGSNPKGTPVIRFSGGNLSLLGNGVVSTNTTLGGDIRTTLTLGSTGTYLDAAQEGASLTLSGGNVVINAKEVGRVGEVRTSGPIGQHTSGPLSIFIENVETRFTATDAVVGANIVVGIGEASYESKAILATSNGIYSGILSVDLDGTVDISGTGNTFAAVANLGIINAKESVTIGGATTGPRAGDTLIGNGTVNIANGKTLTLVTTAQSGPLGGNSTFDGVITGGEGPIGLIQKIENVPPSRGERVNLIKTGPGTQFLTGANTYFGDTIVKEGTLHITGSLGSLFDNVPDSIGGLSDGTPIYRGDIVVATGAKLIFDLTGTQIHASLLATGPKGDNDHYEGVLTSASGGGEIEARGPGILVNNSDWKVGKFTAKDGGSLETSPTIMLDIARGFLDQSNNDPRLLKAGYIESGVFEANTTLMGSGTVGTAVFEPGAVISPGFLTRSPTFPSEAEYMLNPETVVRAFYPLMSMLTLGPLSNDPNHTTTFDHVIFNLDIFNYASSTGMDWITIQNSHTIFNGTNTINLFATPENSPWNDGGNHTYQFFIMAYEGGLGTDLVFRQTLSNLENTTFTFNGSPLEPHQRAFLDVFLNEIKVKTKNVFFALYWNGTQSESGWSSLWEANAPYDWIRASQLKNSNPTPYAFKNGDVVIFSRIGNLSSISQEVTIASTGVKPNTLIVNGEDTEILFKGGPIDVTSYKSSSLIVADEHFAEYEAIEDIPVAVFVENKAKATFNVQLTAPKMNVTGGGRAILGDTPNVASSNAGTPFKITQVFLGNTTDKGTLEFNRTGSNHITFAGAISGEGDVVKSGGATVTLTGTSTYTGKTTVEDGVLSVKGGLGTKSGSNPAIYEHVGELEVASNKILSFDKGTGTAFTQKLSGRLTGGVNSILSVDNRIVEITSDRDNTPTLHPAPEKRNAFKGNLIVSNGAQLIVSGRLDVQEESFDQYPTSPMPRTYSHSSYSGNMTLQKNGTLEFTYNRDLQVTTGALRTLGDNPGTFKVNTGQHFYFMGDGSTYAGNTVITGGSTFHLPAGGQYAPAGDNNSGVFTVNAGSTLVGGGGSAPTELYVKSLTISGGSTLSVAPGGFRVNMTSSSDVILAPNAILRIAVAESMAIEKGTYVVEEIRLQGEETRAPRSGSGSAALSFADADGVVFSGPDQFGVFTSLGVPLNLNVTGTIRVHGPEYYEYVLIDGLDTVSIVRSIGSNNANAAILAIFGTDEINLLGARFQLFFSENKLIMQQMTLSSTVPEPSTYALVGGLGVLALAFWRRRKKGKQEVAKK
jgi:autotransporter-associated beta strand protein